MGVAEDDDATVELKPGAFRPGRQETAALSVGATTRRRLFATMAGGGAAAVGCGICGWLLWSRRPAPPAVRTVVLTPPRPVPAPAPAPAAPERFTITTADEAAILAHVAQHLTVFRFDANPNIIVLDFPSLRMQGEMLNRVASLVEKAGLPHDRVLSDTELAAAIRARGDTPETYYYGHDYSAGALARFFALADRDHVALDPQEHRLNALLRQLGWLAPSATGGLITIVRTSETISETSRATILHHELSHGEFFSDPAYASYVHQFWLHALTDDERQAVRKFLGSMDYDTGIEELMYNEMQAYLMFTYDARFFLPSNVGMTPERRLQLQAAFLKGMPDSWLKAALARHLRLAAD